MSNTQTTINTAAPQTHLNKEYFDKKLLVTARTKFVHAKFGQKRNIPPNNGKKVEFRRLDLFDPELAMSGLTEGVTPDGQALSQSNVEATVKQYGAYTEPSDLLMLTSYDDTVKGSVELLGEQLGTVLDWVTRDAMQIGNNVQYANAKVNRISLTPTDKLTVSEVRKAVRTLKKAKARYFTRSEDGKSARKPHFICICSPDATYDLQSDTLWQDVSKYSNAEQIYSGEIGRLFGVVFVESTEAKVFLPSVVNAVNATTSSATTFVLKNAPSAAGVAYLSTPGAKLYVNNAELTLAASNPYNAETKTVTLSAAASLTADHVVSSADAGAIDATTKVGAPVHGTLIFGAEAYGTIDINGSGAIKSIIHMPGKGVGGPLEQYGTVAAKVPAYTAVILNHLWILRLEHGVTA